MTKSGQIFGFDFRHLALDGSKNGQPEFCIWFRSCGTGLPEALFRRGEVPGGQMAFMSSNRGFFSEKKATPPSRWQVLNVPLQAASQFLMQRSQKFSTVGFSDYLRQICPLIFSQVFSTGLGYRFYFSDQVPPPLFQGLGTFQKGGGAPGVDVKGGLKAFSFSLISRWPMGACNISPFLPIMDLAVCPISFPQGAWPLPLRPSQCEAARFSPST